MTKTASRVAQAAAWLLAVWVVVLIGWVVYRANFASDGPPHVKPVCVQVPSTGEWYCTHPAGTGPVPPP